MRNLIKTKSRRPKTLNIKGVQLPKAKSGRVFIQSLDDLADARKGDKVVVYGAATIAQFQKNLVKSEINDFEPGRGFYEQPPRFPNDKLTSIFSKSSDVVRVQVSEDIVNACDEKNIQITGVGFDGVCNFGLKESAASRKHLVVFCIHKSEAESQYILETWVFFKRRLLSLKESNIELAAYTDPLGNIAGEISSVMDEFDSTSVEYVITGNHNFTNSHVFDVSMLVNREINANYDFGVEANESYFIQKNAQSGNLRFIPYEYFSFAGPAVTKAGEKASPYKLPLVIVAIGGITYSGLYYSGLQEYESAVDSHREVASEIQGIYEKGGAAISLVESRQYYMDELDRYTSAYSSNIRKILVALSKMHNEMPDALARFESLTVSPDGLTDDEDSQFELVLSFHSPNVRTTLRRSSDIHHFLSTELSANTRSSHAPRRTGDAAEERYSLAIIGDFNESTY